jgi:hypothetical protein
MSPARVANAFRAFAALPAGFFLIALVPGVATGAPGVNSSCERIAQQLRGVDLAAREWTVHRVDLMTGSARELEMDDAALPDSPAPLLYLTPRVVNILADIFDHNATDSGDAPLAVDDAVQLTVTAGNAPDENSPPLHGPSEPASESADLEYAIEHGAMREAIYNADSLPRFQRPMYRTDI